MCISSCVKFFSIKFLSGFVPYLWLISVPLYGSFFGTEPILRVSLQMIIHCVILQLFPQVWVALLPYVQVFVFLGLMCLPVNIIPYPIIWFYDKLLWLSEPLWLFIEAAEMVGLCMILSQRLADRIDEQPTLYKSIILMISGCCYIVSLFFGVMVVNIGTPATKWLIVGVIILAIMIHAFSIFCEDGIISDASMVTLFMFGVLYAMSTETYSANHPIEIPPDSKPTLHLSFFKLFFSVTSSSIENGSRAFQFLLKILSPTFLMMVIVRLYSVLSFIKHVIDWMSIDENDHKKNDDDREEDTNPSFVPVESSFAIRLAFIYVMTQVVTNHIHKMTADDTGMSWYPDFFSKDIGLWRVAQIGCMMALYLYKLHSNEEGGDEWWNK